MKKYFRRRNKLVTEYSGHGEVSKALRERIARVCNKYTAKGRHLGVGQERLWVRAPTLEHELFQELNKEDIYSVIYDSEYEDVFTAVEIFLDLASRQASGRFRQVILPDFVRALELSGCVYFINIDGQIELKIDSDLAKKIEKTKEVLEENKDAYKLFFESVGNLLGRKEKPKNVVKDVFIAFEDYLKSKTSTKDFRKAISKVTQQGLITPTQKALLDKIYGYRSDSYGTTHAGKTKEPDEVDALWFIETVVAQIKLLNKRITKNEKS